MSTNRIIVDAKVYDGFVDRFTTHVKGLKVGNPNEPDTAIGPVINQNQLNGHLAPTRAKERGLPFALDLHAGMTHIDDSSVDDTVTGPSAGRRTAASGGSATSGSSMNSR